MSSSFAQPVEPDLLAAAISGEQWAGERIYRLFERPVYTLAYRMCQNPDEAADIMQETFVQALSKLNQYRGDAPFWGWLRMVAVNTSIGHLRKRKRQPLTLVSAEVLEQISAVTDHPGDQADLNAALSRLSDENRSVVWLHDVEGFTHKEIAMAFGKSVSFSKSRLSRAHQQLRDWLTPATDSSHSKHGKDVCPTTLQAN